MKKPEQEPGEALNVTVHLTPVPDAKAAARLFEAILRAVQHQKAENERKAKEEGR